VVEVSTYHGLARARGRGVLPLVELQRREGCGLALLDHRGSFPSSSGKFERRAGSTAQPAWSIWHRYAQRGIL